MTEYKWVPSMALEEDEGIEELLQLCENCGHLTPQLGCDVSYRGDYILRPVLRHGCYFSPSRWVQGTVTETLDETV